MLVNLETFLTLADDAVATAEASFLRAESSAGAADARRSLTDLATAAAAAGFPRVERIAHAAEALVTQGGEARHLVMRAFLRLRDILAALAHADEEPPGDDFDLIAAAQSNRLPSIADTLAHARERLMEVSAEHRDPRLDALLERLAALGSDLHTDAHGLVEDEGVAISVDVREARNDNDNAPRAPGREDLAQRKSK